MQILLPVIIVTVIGLVAGLGLALASKFMAVPTDEKTEKIRECLPGANCGACGFSGCDGYAAAISDGSAAPDKCAPGGKQTAAALSEVLGVEIEAVEKVAFIACNKHEGETAYKYEYTGAKSCAAASLVLGSPLACSFGCIGLGDCAAACEFGAITVKDGVPIVCEDLCGGCGKCAERCPKGVIKLIPKQTQVRVACSNCEKGAGVVKVCKVSCIACGMCERACENGAIKVENNLAKIDYSLCTGCQKCKSACKRKAII